MRKKGFNNNYNSFILFINQMKSNIISCTDVNKKQYMLYFLYNRAKFWKINESDVYDIIIEIFDKDSSDNICRLTIEQYERARTGYSDSRSISNKQFYKKTGIEIYSDKSHTAREYYKELSASDKIYSHHKRVDLLKRLVKRKKDVTVNEILDHFDKHHVKIGRTKFYNTRIFMVIMSDEYKSGQVKVIKKDDGYIIK